MGRGQLERLGHRVANCCSRKHNALRYDSAKLQESHNILG